MEYVGSIFGAGGHVLDIGPGIAGAFTFTALSFIQAAITFAIELQSQSVLVIELHSLFNAPTVPFGYVLVKEGLDIFWELLLCTNYLVFIFYSKISIFLLAGKSMHISLSDI